LCIEAIIWYFEANFACIESKVRICMLC
jgi:hypothetical protein